MVGLIPAEYWDIQRWPTDLLQQEMKLCREDGRLIWRFLQAEINRRDGEARKFDLKVENCLQLIGMTWEEKLELNRLMDVEEEKANAADLS